MSRIDPPLHAGPSLPGGDASAGPSTPRAAPSSTRATRPAGAAVRAPDEARLPREPAPTGAPGAVSGASLGSRAGSGAVAEAAGAGVAVATRAGAGALRRFIWRVAKVGLGVALGLASAGAAALAAFSALA